MRRRDRRAAERALILQEVEHRRRQRCYASGHTFAHEFNGERGCIGEDEVLRDHSALSQSAWLRETDGRGVTLMPTHPPFPPGYEPPSASLDQHALGCSGRHHADGTGDCILGPPESTLGDVLAELRCIRELLEKVHRG